VPVSQARLRLVKSLGPAVPLVSASAGRLGNRHRIRRCFCGNVATTIGNARAGDDSDAEDHCPTRSRLLHEGRRTLASAGPASTTLPTDAAGLSWLRWKFFILENMTEDVDEIVQMPFRAAAEGIEPVRRADEILERLRRSDILDTQGNYRKPLMTARSTSRLICGDEFACEEKTSTKARD